MTATETFATDFERRQERGRRLVEALRMFQHNGPYEPLVTREQVLEAPCAFCRAEAGAECETQFGKPAIFAGWALRGMRGIHMRRYQDVAHDPR